MTSLERVLATLQHREPDRVPCFLLLTMHGAKELGLSIRSYFSEARNVVEGQLRMRKRYGHDCIYAFFYACLEVEAWGGEVRYFDDGPPNAGAPIVKRPDDILRLEPPSVGESRCLRKVLDAIEMLKERVGSDAPIIGVVMSPYSVPVMQMGFERYIELMVNERALFDRLMRINEEFCVAWANAQIRAGATAICYFDPIASTTNVPRDLYLATGYAVAKRTISRFMGPCATHLASGRGLPVVGDIAETGALMLGVGPLDDLKALKEVARGKICLLGNLNGIEMCRWTPRDAEAAVRDVIAQAALGGGFVLSDSHGEVPYFVTGEVLMAIAEAVRQWGRYPLDWMKPNAE